MVPFAAGAVGLTIYKRIHRYPHAPLGEIVEFLTKTAKSALFIIYGDFMEINGFHENHENDGNSPKRAPQIM